VSTNTSALIVNAIVLFAVLEADLGAYRTISRFRILRPLLTAAATVPLFVKPFVTHGSGLMIEVAGIAAGLVVGVVAVALTHVYRSPSTGNAVSRTGTSYALLWTGVIAARSAFSYGSAHWFTHSLGVWMIHNSVSVNALTDGLIVMAVAMTLTRSLGLGFRAATLSDSPAVAPVRTYAHA